MDRLWYRQPAVQWEEALPIGNGSLGGMVYSDTKRDKISLNRDTLWSGKPIDPAAEAEYRKEGHRQLGSVRSSLLNEDYETATKLIEDHLLGGWGESYLPLGDLIIETEQKEPSDEYIEYERELNLHQGLVKMTDSLRGGKISREYLCSFPAQAMLIHTVSDQPVDAVVFFDCPLKHDIKIDQDELLAEGSCPEHVEPDYMGETDEAIQYGEKGIRFQVRISVTSKEGTVQTKQDRIVMKGVREYTIMVAAADSFLKYDKKPDKEYREACRLIMEELRRHDYTWHKARHLEDYQPLYHASEFDLFYRNQQEYEQLPTDERQRGFAEGNEDMGLFCLLLRYSRYLLITASREGSQPTNLQGIWNKNLRAVWSSNYTVNINTQMNYWPVLPLNLAGLQEPLNRMLKELSQAGQITASELYGCRGWTSHHNIDLWRKTTPAGGPWKRRGFSAVRHSMWPMSGAWLCRHLYEQYEYSLDLEFLRETAYPVMRGSALFLLDWLVEMPDGSLQTIPSTSPENEFLIEGEAYGAMISSSMDLFLCRELFQNCLSVLELLEEDQKLKEELTAALLKLPWPKTGEDGRLLEWSREAEEAEQNHRHVSHLYGLYPADLIPEHQLAACEKSLELRGEEGTGWSYAWKACLWARLGRGDRVMRLLRRMLLPVDAKEVDYKNGGIYPDLFMAHPPFQIDANFGIAAAILETVVQCVKERIVLLPALPEEWQAGSVRSVALKNGLLMDLDWEEGRIKKLVLRKVKKGGRKRNRILYRAAEYSLSLEAGEEKIMGEKDFN